MNWNCTACAYPNSDTRRFCARCGTSLGCPECHASNEPEARFCGGCGLALAHNPIAAFSALWGNPDDQQPTLLGCNQAELLIAVEIERQRLLQHNATHPQHLNQSDMDDLFS